LGLKKYNLKNEALSLEKKPEQRKNKEQKKSFKSILGKGVKAKVKRDCIKKFFNKKYSLEQKY
jgi:hypothetical protein